MSKLCVHLPVTVLPACCISHSGRLNSSPRNATCLIFALAFAQEATMSAQWHHRLRRGRPQSRRNCATSSHSPIGWPYPRRQWGSAGIVLRKTVVNEDMRLQYYCVEKESNDVRIACGWDCCYSFVLKLHCKNVENICSRELHLEDTASTGTEISTLFNSGGWFVCLSSRFL